MASLSIKEKLEALRRRRQQEAEALGVGQSPIATPSATPGGGASIEVTGSVRGRLQDSPGRPETIVRIRPLSTAPEGSSLGGGQDSSAHRPPQSSATPPPPSLLHAAKPVIDDGKVAVPLLEDEQAKAAASSALGRPSYHRDPPFPRRQSTFELISGLLTQASGNSQSTPIQSSFSDAGSASLKRPRSSTETPEIDAPPFSVARTETISMAREGTNSKSQGTPNTPAGNTQIPRVVFGPLPGSRKCRNAGEYARGSRISEGVYGVVYKGVENGTHEPFALKWIKSQWFVESRTGFPEYLLREIDLLSRLEHPNIVRGCGTATVAVDPAEAAKDAAEAAAKAGLNAPPVIGNWVSPGSQRTKLFIVTEYAGFTLRSEIYRGEHLAMSAVKFLLLRLLNGIAFMHAHRIVHRDLKPSNILVDLDNEVKLCDMGLARMIRAKEPGLTTAVVTLMYRAPELHVGLRDYGASLDMWSVGCIAAEMLLREPLFPAQEDDEHLRVVCEVMGAPTDAMIPGVLRLHGARERLGTVRITPEAANAAVCYTPLARFEHLTSDARPPAAWSCTRLRQTIIGKRPDLFGDDADSTNRAAAFELLDIVDRILQWNPAGRLTASEALRHPFFTSSAPAPSDADVVARRDAYEHEKVRLRAAEKAKRAAAAAAGTIPPGAPLGNNSEAVEAAAAALASAMADEAHTATSAITLAAAKDVVRHYALHPLVIDQPGGAAQPLSADRVVAGSGTAAVESEDDELLENIGPAEAGLRHKADADDDDDA
jgi:serine/threonine protein kinase